jgi:hypothetical protein
LRLDAFAVDVIQAPKPEPQIMRYELSDYEWTAIKPMLPNLCCRLSVPLSGQLSPANHMAPAEPGHGNGEAAPFVPKQRWRDAASN